MTSGDCKELLKMQTRHPMEMSVIYCILAIFISMESSCSLAGEFFFNLGCSLQDISDIKTHGGLKCIERYR